MFFRQLKRRLRTLSTLAIAGLSLCCAHAAKPNFIFILIDDMGYADLSCYGGVQNITPNIDSIASEGIRFSQFYVGGPICSPSRVAFTTGHQPIRWNVTSFLASRRENERRGMANWLDPKAPTLARILKQAGYATGHFGKWHMGGQRDVGEAPLITEYGFDESLTQFEGLGDRILPLLDAYDGQPPRKHALGSDELGRGKIEWMDRSKVTSAFVERTLRFVREAHSQGKPFYVNLWPDDVHSPFFPPKSLRGDSSKRELYRGVVKAMDEQFAPLFKYLRETPSLRTNTVLVISSDNGPEPGAGSAGVFRSTKGSLYEGGMREPLIVWAPGFAAPEAKGTINNQTVLCAIDFLPSFLKIAAVPLPTDARPDGQDQSAALLGKSRAPRTGALFWSRPPDRPGTGGEEWPDLAARQGDWKLLVMRDGSNEQLYNLRDDPGETKNLAERHPEIVGQLRKPLIEWWNTFPASKAEVPRRLATRESARVFKNPVGEGADPWIVRHGTNYMLIQSEGNRGLALYVSDRLSSLGPKRVIWTAPDEGPYSKEVWAPEIHFVDGQWVVYVAASDGKNKNHKMWALKSEGADPFGKYTVHGPMYTGDHPETGAANRWAIDGTILEHDGKRFFLWSGWEEEKDEQWLYAAEMNDFLRLGKRVRMCDNDDYLWERVGEKLDQRGLHEAPQPLTRDGRTFVIYSCSSSWQPTYKLGLLELRKDGDPLNPADWIKFPEPVFRPTDVTYGAAHNCFVKSPDGNEDWIVYHAKMDRRDGWRRALYMQPFGWSATGFPEFGSPLPVFQTLPLPSGETPSRAPLRFSTSLSSEADLKAFNYFGHHQFIQLKDGRLHLGAIPAHPINDYRSGEKVVVSGGLWQDFSCSATINVVRGGRDAGLLFRCTLPSVGFDAQNGYFAGVLTGDRKVVLGSTDGESWREIALEDADVQAGRDHILRVTATGPEIVVTLDDKEIIRTRDNEHTAGSVGLRVVNTEAAFANLQVAPLRRGAAAIGEPEARQPSKKGRRIPETNRNN